MAPFEIRNLIRRRLRKIKKAMLATEFVFELENEPESVQTEIAKLFLSIHRAIMQLETKQLTVIRDKLKELEGDIVAGENELKQAFEKLDQIQQDLARATAFLQIVNRVISIAA